MTLPNHLHLTIYFLIQSNMKHKVENITSKISDHMPNFIILEKLDLRITKATKIQKRDFEKFNPQKFIVDIKHLDLPQILKHHTNANQSYDVFHGLFIKVINKHAPVKTLTRSEGILKSISKTNNYYSKFLRTKDSLRYHRYKTYRDKINHLIRTSKRNYYRKYFEKFRLNSKKTWTGIKEIINKARNVSSHINLKINGEMVTDQKRVANNNKKRSHTQLDSRKQVIAFQDRVITINIKEAQHPLK